MVNSASASASEVVSGAIKTHRRGVIVGEKTFGKGIQQVPQLLNNVNKNELPFPLLEELTTGNELILKRTTEQFYHLPPFGSGVSQWSNQQIGVQPTIPVSVFPRESDNIGYSEQVRFSMAYGTNKLDRIEYQESMQNKRWKSRIKSCMNQYNIENEFFQSGTVKDFQLLHGLYATICQ